MMIRIIAMAIILQAVGTWFVPVLCADTVDLDANIRTEAVSKNQKSPSHFAIVKSLPLSAIIIYQKFISPQQGGVCNFEPSCSAFGLEAIKRHGIIEGSLMTSDRLQRCNYCVAGEYYFKPGGRFYDPVRNHHLGEDLNCLEYGYVEKALTDTLSQGLTKSACDETKLPYKSPFAAGMMSMVLPGSGQMYLHRFGDGTFSMLLTLGTTWLGSHYHREGYKVTGNILTGLGITFYGGNIYGAAASAKLINASHHTDHKEKHSKKDNLSRDSLEKVMDNQPDDSLKKLTGIAIAQTYIDEENFEAARFELDELAKDNLPDSELHYWKGITYLHEYKWKTAQIEFNQVTDGKWLDTTKKLSPYVEQALHLPYLSEKRALRLSTFIPGTGQMYSGKVMDGIISFAFNASMVYFVSERVKADDFVGSGLIFSVGLLRFYQGNKVNAYQAAQKYNERLNSQALNRMGILQPSQ
ncbi:MAG: membrane protein insertion efficiency factor YidD [Candidatus Desantisbacteria bacterium]